MIAPSTIPAAMIKDEGWLVHQAQNGDREAFNELVRLYRLPVINLLFRIYGDEALAEDAAQTALVRAWQNLPRFRHGASFRNWILGIAMHCAIDNLRKERHEYSIDAIDEPSHSMQDDNPEQSLEQRQRSDLVQQAVLALPAASRMVLVLREYEGYSYQEIANILDIPIGTVMSRLNYARKALLDRLKPVLEDL